MTVLSSLFASSDITLLVTLGLLIMVSSVLQTVTGFGFAILSAPIGAALVGGPGAVGMVIIAGTAVDILILTLRRRRPRPRWDEVGILGVSSLPGLALGAYLLMVLPARLLLVLIAAPLRVRLSAALTTEPLAVTTGDPAGCAVIVTASPSLLPEVGGEYLLIGMICSCRVPG